MSEWNYGKAGLFISAFGCLCLFVVILYLLYS
jgi:hypothetical protein